MGVNPGPSPMCPIYSNAFQWRRYPSHFVTVIPPSRFRRVKRSCLSVVWTPKQTGKAPRPKLRLPGGCGLDLILGETQVISYRGLLAARGSDKAGSLQTLDNTPAVANGSLRQKTG